MWDDPAHPLMEKTDVRSEKSVHINRQTCWQAGRSHAARTNTGVHVSWRGLLCSPQVSG